MPARPVPRPAELGEVVRIPLPRLRGGSAESAVQRLRNGSALALSPRSEASSTLGEVRRTERPLGATRNAENLLSRAVQNGGRVCGRHCDERSRRVKSVSRRCDPERSRAPIRRGLMNCSPASGGRADRPLLAHDLARAVATACCLINGPADDPPVACRSWPAQRPVSRVIGPGGCQHARSGGAGR
jgi:hypothetical protein